MPTITSSRTTTCAFASERRCACTRLTALTHPQLSLSRYYFLCQPYHNGLLGLFPGVVNKRGGIYWAVSRDAVHWSKPKRLMSSPSKERRTADHPVSFEILREGGYSELRLHVEHNLSTYHGLSLLANTSRPYHCIYSFNHTRLEPLLLKALHSLPAPTRSDLRPQPAPVREAPRISKLKDIMSHLTAEEAEMWRRERMSFEAPAEHEVEEHEPQGRHLSVAAGVGSVCGAGWICWLVRWWSRSRAPEI